MGRGVTYSSNRSPNPTIHDPKHGITDKRPEQPSRRSGNGGRGAEDEKRVQAEDVHGVEVLGAEEGDAGGGGVDGGEDRGGEVVVASFSAEVEVGVPG